MARRGVVVHAEARRELLEAQKYYDERRDGYGPLFVDAIEREFELLLEFPRIGKPIVMGAGGIYVIAIAHHRRRPDYWSKRIKSFR